MLYEVRANVGATLPAEDVGAAQATHLELERDKAQRRMYAAILSVLDQAGIPLEVENRGNIAGLERVSFVVTTTRDVHAGLLKDLRASDTNDEVVVYRDVEEE